MVEVFCAVEPTALYWGVSVLCKVPNSISAKDRLNISDWFYPVVPNKLVPEYI